LDQPQALSGLLEELGLRSMHDVGRLNAPEQLELAESLWSAGVNLGSRSKLRLLANADAAADHGLGVMGTGANVPPRQMQENQPASAAASKPYGGRRLQNTGGGPSMDSLALATTAILGIASYLMQAKISREATANQNDSEQSAAESVRMEAKAEKLLIRVQDQMRLFIQPLTFAFVSRLGAPLHRYGG
jgi:hypothetical protein